ncbi:MAG: MBOAT family protein, partial [Euryarchaeota archaeon]|nr:MBOAT family protein [Euryarchaeota archaeon]
MDFVTPGYYYWFLPITMALYFALLKGKQENRIILLVIMSYIFFFLSSGWYFILLAVSTCTDWIAGKRISVSDDISVKKRWLYASLSINLGLLAVFKYLDFLIESLNLITLKLPSSPEISTLGLILPVGISFYTFQTMSYTIDIYRGSGKPYDKFTDFACYASFFPQLVAGPIVRSQEFIEQINKPREFSISRTRLELT